MSGAAAATNLLDHPLTSPDWELVPASPVRTDGRALWRQDRDGERIVHARWVQGVSGTLRVERVGVRRGVGYHKCASAHEWDAPMEVRLLADREGTLQEVGAWSLDGPPGPDDTVWWDARVEASTLVAVIERAAIDDGWPSWNLARTGLILDGVATEPWRRGPEHLLAVEGDAGARPVPGVRVDRRHDTIRFMTDRYAIGFRLRSPRLAFLAIDDDASGRTDRDLLVRPRSMDIVRAGLYPAGVYPVLRDPQAGYLAQGPRLTLLDGREPAAFLGYGVHGTVRIDGSSVSYDLGMDGVDVRTIATWRMDARGIELELARSGHEPLDAWISSAWHIATSTRVTPSTALGELVPVGQTGLVRAPATWHLPGHGSFVIEGDDRLLLRSDTVRALDTSTLEFKIDETPGPDGTYRLEARPGPVRVRLEAGTPRLVTVPPQAATAVRRALDRHLVTALTFRADTGTFSNNGASMHCAGSLNPLGDLVATGAARTRHRQPDGIDPVRMLARSLERWLAGAPGYGSGATSRGDFTIADEYLMLGADALYGLGRLLEVVDRDWFERQEARIGAALEDTRGRDLDGDGLIESRLREGISGEHQWSTTWADVVSFGWKDAWTNAVLHGALRAIARGYRRFDRDAAATDLDAWADRLRTAYMPAFRSPERGWIAGWRSPDGRLHDHGYPLINGDAVMHGLVEGDEARAVMARVWAALEEVGYRDLANGIPINLYPIPEEDLGGVVFGLPIGGYLQGGATHHRTGGFVRALRLVGMTSEADLVLEALASTVADDSAFGGVGSGLDWRLWDGTPSGYEGMLAEGFGFLADALEGPDPRA